MGKYTDPHRVRPAGPRAPESRIAKRKYTIVHNNDKECIEESVVDKPTPRSRKYVTTLRPTTLTTLIEDEGDKGRKFGEECRNVDKLVFDALLCITDMHSKRGDAITYERWRWSTQATHVWFRKAEEMGVAPEEFCESAQRLIDRGLVVGNPFGLSGSWAICGGVKPAGQREVDSYLRHREEAPR